MVRRSGRPVAKYERVVDDLEDGRYGGDGDASSSSASGSAFAASSGPSDLSKDYGNMALLVFMYALQGIPMGLCFGSMPFLLQERMTYTQLATFSLATWPYSLKLAWSPLVDSKFFASIGRRKSWIVPMQYGIGLLFFYLSLHVELMTEMTHVPVQTLTGLFFVLVLMTATQDIAVDGWALTMLSRANVSYASTCQSAGLQIGYYLSFTVFLALNSADASNRWFRSAGDEQSVGVLTLTTFLQICAVVYLIFTTLIWALKHERAVDEEDEDHDVGPPVTSAREAYRTMFRILALPAIRNYILILLTFRIPFAAADAITPYKLMERGFHKEQLAMLAIIQFPFEIFFAVAAGHWSRTDKPLRPWLRAFVARLAISSLGPILVYSLAGPNEPGGGADANHPLWLWALVLTLSLAKSFIGTVMFVVQGAFFNRISDPAIGGTYLTLLNTLANFGGTMPSTLALSLVDVLSVSHCDVPEGTSVPDDSEFLSGCASQATAKACTEYGGSCDVERDGYFSIAVICFLAGIAYYPFVRRAMARLQELPLSAWRVSDTAAARPLKDATEL